MPAHPESLVLASASPRRRDLLQRMGLQFDVCPSNVEEDDRGLDGPKRMVAKNSALKAEALANDYPDALILGSDTTVAFGSKILSKPADLKDAARMLMELSGREHVVYTAVSLRCKAGQVSVDFVETSTVQFKELNDRIIAAYFQQVNPLDKAGAYGIQEAREMIIKQVDGSVENVMGLPIQTLAKKLTELGFDFTVQN
ncbi:MAG: Maf family protein [Verrucomicrobiota bacterium]